jgi:hypothetical protein
MGGREYLTPLSHSTIDSRIDTSSGNDNSDRFLFRAGGERKSSLRAVSTRLEAFARMLDIVGRVVVNCQVLSTILGRNIIVKNPASIKNIYLDLESQVATILPMQSRYPSPISSRSSFSIAPRSLSLGFSCSWRG